MDRHSGGHLWDMGRGEAARPTAPPPLGPHPLGHGARHAGTTCIPGLAVIPRCPRSCCLHGLRLLRRRQRHPPRPLCRGGAPGAALPPPTGRQGTAPAARLAPGGSGGLLPAARRGALGPWDGLRPPGHRARSARSAPARRVGPRVVGRVGPRHALPRGARRVPHSAASMEAAATRGCPGARAWATSAAALVAGRGASCPAAVVGATWGSRGTAAGSQGSVTCPRSPVPWVARVWRARASASAGAALFWAAWGSSRTGWPRTWRAVLGPEGPPSGRRASGSCHTWRRVARRGKAPRPVGGSGAATAATTHKPAAPPVCASASRAAWRWGKRRAARRRRERRDHAGGARGRRPWGASPARRCGPPAGCRPPLRAGCAHGWPPRPGGQRDGVVPPALRPPPARQRACRVSRHRAAAWPAKTRSRTAHNPAWSPPGAVRATPRRYGQAIRARPAAAACRSERGARHGLLVTRARRHGGTPGWPPAGQRAGTSSSWELGPRCARQVREGWPEAKAAGATRAVASGMGAMGGGGSDRATPHRLCMGRCNSIPSSQTIR